MTSRDAKEHPRLRPQVSKELRAPRGERLVRPYEQRHFSEREQALVQYARLDSADRQLLPVSQDRDMCAARHHGNLADLIHVGERAARNVLRGTAMSSAHCCCDRFASRRN